MYPAPMMMPVAASTPAHWLAVNPPRIIRNSPTNPLVEGRPIEASVNTMKSEAYSGITEATPP